MVKIKKESNVFYGIDITNIKKIDKMSNGVHKIVLGNNRVEELSLDEGESAELFDLYNRYRQKDNASQLSDESEKLPSAEEIEDPRFSRNPLERNLGSNMSDIELEHPTLKLVGYWAIPEDVPKYLKFGYAYAEPRDVKDYRTRFSENNPGQGISPDGKITMNGHILLVAPEKIARQRHDFYYKQREALLITAKEAESLGDKLLK